MKGYIGRMLPFLLAAQLFESNNYAPNERPMRKAKVQETGRPIPNGCKEYFFNHLGEFLNKNDGLYAFKCVAINDKSAIKKFEKWATNQPMK